jgi:hypothetical protein
MRAWWGGCLSAGGCLPGVHLLAVILGQPGRQRGPELLECSSQSAGPPVGLASVRQHPAQVRPVARHLGPEGRLAAPAEQVPDLGYRQRFGVDAGRAGAGRGGTMTGPASIRS